MTSFMLACVSPNDSGPETKVPADSDTASTDTAATDTDTASMDTAPTDTDTAITETGSEETDTPLPCPEALGLTTLRHWKFIVASGGGLSLEYWLEDVDIDAGTFTYVEQLATGGGSSEVRSIKRRQGFCDADGAWWTSENGESSGFGVTVTFESTYTPPYLWMPTALDVGTTWRADTLFHSENSEGAVYDQTLGLTFLAGPVETLDTPAGMFEAIPVTTTYDGYSDPTRTEWYTPGTGRVGLSSYTLVSITP